MMFFLIGIVYAQECDKVVDDKEAVETYTTIVPQFTETQETSSRIKEGYYLNEDDGQFYEIVKCVENIGEIIK